MRDGAGLTDGQLLELFIAHKDQAAFEALVRRHGTMVLKVCHRVIRNHHDAEDAFQATFLVLARKASIREAARHGRQLAPWRRLPHRPQSQNVESEKAGAGEACHRHARTRGHGNRLRRHYLQPLLDQELSRLAEIYRLPILLCDLEGKSIKKTAQQLGWPQGTVAGRLARGKNAGETPGPARIGVGGRSRVVGEFASACVPPSLVAATVKAASVYTAGKSAATGMISANVAILMEGMMKTMFLTKLKIASAVLVVAVTAGIGGGILTRSTTVAAQTGRDIRNGGREAE